MSQLAKERAACILLAMTDPRLNLLWNRFSGFYLAQLHIMIKTDLGRDDSHFVGYLAADNLIMDDYPRSKLTKIEAKDRERKNAPKVFYALFPGARQTTMGAVYELTGRGN